MLCYSHFLYFVRFFLVKCEFPIFECTLRTAPSWKQQQKMDGEDMDKSHIRWFSIWSSKRVFQWIASWYLDFESSYEQIASERINRYGFIEKLLLIPHENVVDNGTKEFE